MSEKVRILVVEDMPKWQDRLKIILEKAGYSVTVAGSAHAAKKQLSRGTAELIVLDMSLIIDDASDRQGRGILKQIRDKNLHIPVVCISAYLKPSEAVDVVARKGAKWFFDKAEFAERQYEFLQEIKCALSISAAERSERWRAIERRLRPGD